MMFVNHSVPDLELPKACQAILQKPKSIGNFRHPESSSKDDDAPCFNTEPLQKVSRKSGPVFCSCSQLKLIRESRVNLVFKVLQVLLLTTGRKKDLNILICGAFVHSMYNTHRFNGLFATFKGHHPYSKLQISRRSILGPLYWEWFLLHDWKKNADDSSNLRIVVPLVSSVWTTAKQHLESSGGGLPGLYKWPEQFGWGHDLAVVKKGSGKSSNERFLFGDFFLRTMSKLPVTMVFLVSLWFFWIFPDQPSVGIFLLHGWVHDSRIRSWIQATGSDGLYGLWQGGRWGRKKKSALSSSSAERSSWDVLKFQFCRFD